MHRNAMQRSCEHHRKERPQHEYESMHLGPSLSSNTKKSNQTDMQMPGCKWKARGSPVGSDEMWCAGVRGTAPAGRLPRLLGQ